jgi:hypothetical protein
VVGIEKKWRHAWAKKTEDLPACPPYLTDLGVSANQNQWMMARMPHPSLAFPGSSVPFAFEV